MSQIDVSYLNQVWAEVRPKASKIFVGLVLGDVVHEGIADTVEGEIALEAYLKFIENNPGARPVGR